MDGGDLIVLRVPRLPPEPSASQIAEHELTGHAVHRSWCCHRVAFEGCGPTLTLALERSVSIMASSVVRERRCVADLVCQMRKQFNWMLDSNSC